MQNQAEQQEDLTNVPRRWDPARAEALFQAIEKQKVSIASFARREGLSAALLYHWRSKLRDLNQGTGSGDTVRFAQARVASASSEAARSLDILSPGGWTIRYKTGVPIELLQKAMSVLGGVA